MISRPHVRLAALLIVCRLLHTLSVADGGGSASRSAISSPPADHAVFRIGEELIYNVSYASFDIGQVKIQLLDTVRQDGILSYKAKASIDSYKGVPFVNLHAVFESIIADSEYSTFFHSRTKEDEGWMSHIYTFDYPAGIINVDKKIFGTEKILHHDTLRISGRYQDGLSLFFYARTHVKSKQSLDIPTVVNEKRGVTHIDFTNERATEEIDAVDYPIDLVHFEGEAGFVGIFGLTGAFEGWFSNDDARVPIVAKMKVLIGNVRLELMKWKREGWTPPRAPESGK